MPQTTAICLNYFDDQHNVLMYTNMEKNKIRMFVAIIVISTLLISCSSSKKMSNGTGDKKDMATWYNSREWLNGLKLIPHESVNQQEFSAQYHRNKVWWDKAFEFLRTDRKS